VTEDSDNNNDLYAAESQFVWDGWSLSVPRPGKSINTDDSVPTKEEEAAKYATPENAQFDLNVRFYPVPGTLPRLRFGKKYRVRIRTVDLAGNSIPLNTNSTNADTIRRLIYKRFEPVVSPFPVLGNYERAGESVEVMVIRSNGKDANIHQFAPLENNPEGVPFKTVSTRYIFPPEVDQMTAEKHSKFDAGIGNDKSEADIDNQYDNVIIPHDHDLQNPAKVEGQIFSSPNIRIDYLPDPLAAGLTIWHGKPQKLIAKVPFYPGASSWPDPTPITFDLTESASFNVDTSQINNSKIIFGLPPGTMETVWVGSYFEESALEILGVWDMAKKKKPNPVKTPTLSAKVLNWKKFMVNLPANEKPYMQLITPTSTKVKQGIDLTKLKEHVLNGGHWMFTPKRKYRLTHAIHQPYEKPVIDFINTNRGSGSVSVDLSHQVTVHGFSTEKIDIVAKWEDPVDDLSKDCWESIPQKQQVAARTIKYNDTTESYKDPYKRHINHKFGDTKARRVDYTAIGATRYREYFFNLVDKADNDANFNFPITRTSDPKVVIIKSSARPSIPKVEYMIQLNAWDNQEQPDAQVHTRLGGMFRVYLKRPWFSSGAGELLGVCLYPTDLTQISSLPNTTFAVNLDPLDPIYTRWAHDPISYPKSNISHFPRVNNFDLYAAKAQGLEIEDFPNRKVDVVGYPVQFDGAKQLWYADIKVNHPNGEYFPFLRLNLCRFQPDSIAVGDKTINGQTIFYDHHLSKIVKPDFVQLMPEKQSSIKLASKTNFEVRLSGPVFYENVYTKTTCLSMVEITVEKK
ncbi:MAG: hypothetical protein AAF598_20130, partial [Bacteroidota bacterium]